MIGVCAAFAVIATLLGPRMLATDWRRDLAKVELLKTYPLGGFSLAAAEIGAPLVGITAVQLVLLGLVAVLLPFAAVAQGELSRGSEEHKFELQSHSFISYAAFLFIKN